ncbi:MAG: RHS repeat-associated core domain-containing protein [Minicystis sp.]
MLAGLTAIPGSPLAASNDDPGTTQPDAVCPPDGEDILNISLPPSNSKPATPLTGAFEVSSEGSAGYQIPLTVAPGRAGMAPSLSLDYSSNNDEEGILGVGFSVSGFSTIERCAKTLELDSTIKAVSFTFDDALCLDGNRLVWTGETGVDNGLSYQVFRTRVDGGDRIVGYWRWGASGPNWEQFEVFHRSGLVSTYGAAGEARVMAKGGAAASWLEDRRHDRRGNAIVYHYQNDHDPSDGHSLEVVPSEIAYTEHPSQPAQRKVVFEYGSLGEDARPLVTYRDGLRRHTSKRLEHVRMVGPGNSAVRSYHLTYDKSPASGRDRLREVKECAKDSDADAHCRPPIQFQWAASDPDGPVKKVGTPVIIPPDSSFDDEAASFDYHMADVNGDGLDDVVMIQMNDDTHVVRVALATGGLEAQPFAAPEVWAVLPKPAGFVGYERVGRYKVEVGDLDSDGNVDLMLDEPFHQGGSYMWLRAQPASKTFVLSDTGITRQNYPDDVPEQVQKQDPFAFQSVRYVDLDGDGVLDALSCRDTNWIDWNSYSSTYEASKVTWRLRLGVPGTGTFGAPEVVDLDGTGCGADIREVDLDGDGKVELVRRHWESAPLPPGEVFSKWKLGPYVASELVGSAMFSHEIEGLQYVDVDGFGMSQLRFADVNHDGLPDAVHLVGAEMNNPLDGNDLMVMLVQHNTGRGFTMGAAVVSPVLENKFNQSGSISPLAWFDYWYSRGQLFDVNGDGRADLLTPWENNCGSDACYGVVSLNRRFDSVAAGDYLKVTTQVLSIPYLGIEGESQPSTRFRPHFADVNGDGRTDFLAPDLMAPAPGGGFMLAAYQMASTRDRVVAIHDGTNPKDPGDPGYVPTVAISYGNLVDLERTWAGINTENVGSTLDGTLSDPKERYRARADGSNDCAYPRKCLVGTRQVVKSYAVENGLGGARTYAVQLRDGRYDVRSRQALGFDALRIIDTDTLAGRASFFDNVTYDSTLEVYPYAHQVKASWKWTPPLKDQDSQRLRVEYVSRSLLQHKMPGRYFTVPWYTRTRVDETDFDVGVQGYAGLMDVVATMAAIPGDVLRDSTRVITDFDDLGNVLAEHEQTDGVDELRTTRREFANDTDAWILGRETGTRVCSQSLGMQQCRVTERHFNGFGELTLVRVGDAGEPATRLETQYAHDSFGNVVLTRQYDGYGKKRSTCAAYDQEGVFPVTTANALGHVSYARYDRGLGVVTGRRDPNGLTTQVVIDGLGRAAASYNMDGTWRKSDLTRGKVTTLGGSFWRMTSTVERSDGATETTTMDSHGRVIGTAKAAPIGPACHEGDCVQDGTIVTEVVYDDRGLVKRRSMPHLSGQKAATIDEHAYVYDALGREVSHATPWGSTVLTEYHGNTTWRTTPLGTTTVEVDPLGRETTITDALQGTTTFTYGPFGNVWYVDALGLVTASVYDAYGRRINHVDPDRGTTIVEYDGYGQRLRELDALGRVHELFYDALGRTKRRVDPDGTTTWQYDGAAFGKGKIHKVMSPTGVEESFVYDGYGRLGATSVKVGVDKFATSFEYDPMGRLETITYPEDELGDNQIVKNEYDARGYLTAVKALLPYPQLPNTYELRTMWKIDEVDGAGHVRRFTLGNSAKTLQEYSPADSTLRKIETNDKNGNPIQALRYDYDDSLLLTARFDDLQGKVERFEHDDLGRIRCGYFGNLKPQACSTDIEYEPNGNIHEKSGVGTYQYHPDHPHAVQVAGNLGFEYDAVGNRIGRPGVSIDYTAFDLPSRYTLAGGGHVSFLYSGGQERVRKISDTEERTTVGRYYDRRVDLVNGTVEHRYRIFSPEREVAAVIRVGGESEVEYEHTDHLGSLDVVTDQKGSATRRLSFDAFGAQRDPVWGTNHSGSLDPIESLGFTGQEHDTEAGIINMRGRLYDPVIGRFLNVDPKVPNPRSTQSWNPYSYVLNSPLSLVDPNGLEEKDPPKQAAIVSTVPVDEAVDGEDQHFLVTLDDGTDYVVTAGEINAAVRGYEQNNGPRQVQDESRAPEAVTKSTAEPVQNSSQAGAQAGPSTAPAAQAGKAPPAPAPAPYYQVKTPHVDRPARPAENGNCDDCWVFSGGFNLGGGVVVAGGVENGAYIVPQSGERGVYQSGGSQIGATAGAGAGVGVAVTFNRKDLEGKSQTLNIGPVSISFSTKEKTEELCGNMPNTCYTRTREAFDRFTGLGYGHGLVSSGAGNVVSLGESYTQAVPIIQSWYDFVYNREPKPAPPPSQPSR